MVALRRALEAGERAAVQAVQGMGGAGLEAVRSAVLGELRERGGWLLVFDNAQDPAGITGWLPGGGGHVLITSRERKWAEIAAPVEVDVLDRPESAALLQGSAARTRTCSPGSSATCRWPWRRLPGSWPRPACLPPSTQGCCGHRRGS